MSSRSKKIQEKLDFNCASCEEADNDQMVECVKCKKWHHHTCVGTMEEDVRDVEWLCPVCVETPMSDKSKTQGSSRTSRSHVSLDSTLQQLKEMEASERESQVKIQEAKAMVQLAKQQAAKQQAEAMIQAAKQQAEVVIQQVAIEEAMQQLESEQAIQNLKLKYASKRLEVTENCRSSIRSSKKSSVSGSDIVNRTKVWVSSQAQNVVELKKVKDSAPAFNPNEDPNMLIQSRHVQIIHSTPYNNKKVENDKNIQFDKFNPQSKYPPKDITSIATKRFPSVINDQSRVSYPALSRSQIHARQGIEKIELPVFDGNVSEWPRFITAYKSSTERCGYNDVENMIRLNRALKGKALQAVKGHLLFPEQVPRLIERLTELFGRPVNIVAEIISNIRKISRIGEDDMNGIMEMSYEVSNLCGIIEATEATEYYHHSELLQLLIEKLPGHLRMSWSKFTEKSQEPSLLGFQKWLDKVSVRAGRVMNINKSNKGEKIKSVTSKFNINHHEGSPNQSSSKMSLPTKHTNDNNLCKICEKSEHAVAECNVFKSLNKRERWNAVVANRLCGRCLKAHNWKSCSNLKVCGVDGCERRHHALLHRSTEVKSNESTQASSGGTKNINYHAPEIVKSTIAPTKQEINIHNAAQKVYYRIVPVVVHGPEKSIDAYAFLDEGSSITMMEDYLAESLSLSGRRGNLCLKWTGSVTRVEGNSRCVSVSIAGVSSESSVYTMKNVRTVKELNLPTQTVELSINERNNRHLKGIPITMYKNARPSLLIGSGNSQIIVPRETKVGLWNEPIAVKCKLGWTIYGSSKDQQVAAVNLHNCECDGLESIQVMMKNYFSLGSFGVSSSPEVISEEDKRARRILENTIKFEDNRYTTALLWKSDSPNLPESRNGALRRLACFERKLLRDKPLREFVSESIKSYVQNGYIRKLTDTEIDAGPKTWYLPIFTVTNTNKRKHRIVWDAACQSNGVSLNSELLTGPDQLSSLIFVLYNFRSRRFGVTADIKEMFHQIGIEQSDQDAQRFLWRECDQSRKPDEYVMQVCTFGAKCSPSVAQFVKNYNAQKFSESHPRACKAILDNHYVDDYLDSFDTECEAEETSSRVRDIHRSGGFVLRNWISNSKRVLHRMNDESNHESVKQIEDKNDLIQRVLGTQWETSTDTFIFNVNFEKINGTIESNDGRPTKRHVLRTLMSTFDPLGLISPYIVEGKLLMQNIWRSSIEWDEDICKSFNFGEVG